ncbi:phosphoenolpyruvate carboxylase [Bradyrhizobium frederickii]|uniref:Phosphoenolpyruvate carboxylase n=1 Tax=Bradyrhizobium frederickii TaxID=2560054 RepID=A0A4Y9L5R6_9BRAD|nr:phosphoenolpyruvate carboxylase [Bradyrhizobium frederickii]TFV37644.1 phosphoenolpyruvate carboxylase [Bradyrhizobium frederickii]
MYSHEAISEAKKSETDGKDRRIAPSMRDGVASRIATSQQIFEQIWNVFISILREDILSDGDAVVVSEADLDEIYGEPQSIRSIAQGAANRVKERSLDPHEMRTLRVALMRQLLINASLQACLNRQRRDVAIFDQNECRPSRCDSAPLRMELGLHCQETEFLRAKVVNGLRGLVQVLERVLDQLPNDDSLECAVHDALQGLWDAIWSDEDVDLIAMQLLYADSMYAALPQALGEASSLLSRQGIDPAGLETCLRPYTWLYGDRDGRPHDTDAHTERLIVALEKGVRANYQRDLAEIAEGHPASDIFRKLADRLDTTHPEAVTSSSQLLAELEVSGLCADERVRALMLRIGVFGFHYLKIEFRQNAAMFTEVVDSIIPPGLIAGTLGPGRPSRYAQLSTAERVELLSQLHGRKGQHQDMPEELWRRFWDDNGQAFHDKAAHYQGRDYIDIYNVDREHIRVLNALNTLNTLKLLKRYSDRITIHGIAEAGSIDEPLALLFLLAAAGHRNGVDIALQPEDLAGAEAMLQQIEDLYANPVYREHLELRGRRQFITFGPSDTGKQGGKAMHIANMQIAKRHRAIAGRFGIEVVPSIVIGYEHARSNGPIAENLERFDAFTGRDVRYMLSGILEMRSHLLTPVMAHQCLRDLLLASAMRRSPFGIAKPSRGAGPDDVSRVDWIAIVRLYKQRFFEHPVLPALLRGIARFDIVRANSKSTRPPSRAFDLQDLESRPDAIRAIPWTRALMLSGVRHELIGAGLLAVRDVGELQDLYRADATFRGYVKNIAYAAARTRIELAWRTLTGSLPEWCEVVALANSLRSSDMEDPRQLLASIHVEYVQAKRFVYKAQYGLEAARPEDLTAEQLLSAWPVLAEEVAWKEREIDRYIPLLVATKREAQNFTKAAIQEIYSGFVLSANTDLYFYAADEPDAPRQESKARQPEHGDHPRHHSLRAAV